ncbi:MAG: Ig-like domain-containing protein, partial [Bacteroidota bacterium]
AGGLFEDAAVMGINRLRIEVRSGIENPVDYWSLYRSGALSESEWKKRRYEVINDNNDPNVINPAGFQFSEIDNTFDRLVLPFQDRVRIGGEKLQISLAYADSAASPFRHAGNPEEYAEFMDAVITHIKDRYGFLPDAIEVCLEPDLAGWSPTQLATAVLASAKRFPEPASFIAPSTSNAAAALTYITTMTEFETVGDHIRELSYHRYGTTSDGTLRAIASQAASFSAGTAMLEHQGGGYEELHKDLKLASCSSWQLGRLARMGANDDGSAYFFINTAPSGRPYAVMGTAARYLRQYFRYVHRGAVRIDVETTDPAFDPVAFINTDKGHVVVVKSDTAGTFHVAGLPAGAYGITYTTAADYGTDAPDTTIPDGGTLEARMPGKGVLTIHAIDPAIGGKDTTPPTVTITSPVNGETITRRILRVQATAVDNVAMAGVQFTLDGANLEAALPVPPYVINTDIASVSPGWHTLRAMAWDQSDNITISDSVRILIAPNIDTLAPHVAITTPVYAAKVTKPIIIHVDASDNIGVTGVQVQLDEMNIGDTMHAPPYDLPWDPAAIFPGLHNLTAIAFDAAGNQTMSQGVPVIVQHLSGVDDAGNANGGITIRDARFADGTIIIRFDLAREETAHAVLYDEAGRMVMEGTETGHTLLLRGAGLPNGIYLYRLTAGSVTASGRVIVRH